MHGKKSNSANILGPEIKSLNDQLGKDSVVSHWYDNGKYGFEFKSNELALKAQVIYTKNEHPATTEVVGLCLKCHFS